MRFLAVLLAALALLLPGPAAADERILDWTSDIQVRRDGALDVSETIKVQAEGNSIQHGIFRDFPTEYSKGGRRVRIGFDVHQVTLDGETAPYKTEGLDNGVRVRIGSADSYVQPGVHTYRIDYTTTDQLGYFPGYDELYWNVTGNGWMFPIDSVRARVRLPEDVPFGRERAFYTGSQGATDSFAEVAAEGPGTMTVESTAPLAPYEGLTIAVRWPKGVVDAPVLPSAAARTFERYAPPVAALLALFGLLSYYFVAWRDAGRGPRPGTVVPIFSPPDDLSPAAMRYVKKMGYDSQCYAAAVVDSGVHHRLKITEETGGFLSGRKSFLSRAGGTDPMPAPERAMLTELFKGSDTIEMDDENHARFSAAGSALQEGLEGAYKDVTFKANLSWAWLGLALLLAAVAFIAIAVSLSDTLALPSERALAWLGLALMAGGIVLLLVMKRSVLLRLLGGICLIGGAVASAFAFFAIVVAAPASHWAWIFLPLLALPFVFTAFSWMAAPTKEGRAIMDRIAGFEQYLSITEEDRLEAMHPPQKTPELFERYLPYAIALGVENRWADQFADVLTAAQADPNRQDNTFGWYSGSNNVWSNPSRFAGAMGSSLASTISSASTAPGSSSGSGGGGSSGGGGGGGGGGGW